MRTEANSANCLPSIICKQVAINGLDAGRLGVTQGCKLLTPRSRGQLAFVLVEKAKEQIHCAFWHVEHGLNRGPELIVSTQKLSLVRQVLFNSLLDAGVENLMVSVGSHADTNHEMLADFRSLIVIFVLR